MNTGLIANRVEDLESVEPPAGMPVEEIKFAFCIIQGFTPIESIRKALGNKIRQMSPTQIGMAASNYRKKPLVQKYTRALVKELGRVAVANALDLQMFLSAAIFTPIGAIDENHPLCQKKTTTIRVDKDGGTTEKISLESVSKLGAAQALIRMQGLDAPIKVDVNHAVGVMIVPMATNVEDWEGIARLSQQDLMEDAIDI